MAIITFNGSAFAQNATERIKLNQLGFYPNTPKFAVVTGAANQTDFIIASPDLKTTFYTGKLSDEKKSANSSTVTKIADFSAFTKNGTYVVLINGLENFMFSTYTITPINCWQSAR